MERGQNCRNHFFECPFWCRECQMLLDGPCVMHGVMVKDNESPENGLPPDTSLVDFSLPIQLAFANKKMDNDIEVREVITKERTGILTVFGPIVSPLTMTFGRQGLMVKKNSAFGVRYPNGTVATYDGKSPLTCNWMSQVRLEPNRDKANLMAFQHLDKVFFASVKDIPAGSELCVAYSRIYACAIGKDSVVDKPMNTEQKFFRCYNEDGFRHHDLHDLPSLYFPPGVQVPQYMVSISKGNIPAQPSADTAVQSPQTPEEFPVSDSDISEERPIVSPPQTESVNDDPTSPEVPVQECRAESPEILPPSKRARPSLEKARSISPEIPVPVTRLPKRTVETAQPVEKRFKIPPPLLEKIFPKPGTFGQLAPLNISDLDPGSPTGQTDPAPNPESSTPQPAPRSVPTLAERAAVFQPMLDSLMGNPRFRAIAPSHRVALNPPAEIAPLRPPRMGANMAPPFPSTVPGLSPPRLPFPHPSQTDPHAVTAYYAGFLNALKQIPADLAPHQLVFNLPHPTDASRSHRIVLNPQQRPVLSTHPRPSPSPSRPGGPSMYSVSSSSSTVQWRPSNVPQAMLSPNQTTVQTSGRTPQRPVESHVSLGQDLPRTSLFNSQPAVLSMPPLPTTSKQVPQPFMQMHPPRQPYPQSMLPPQIPPAQTARRPPNSSPTAASPPPRLITPNLHNQPGFHPLQHTVAGLPPNLKVVTLPPSVVGPSAGAPHLRQPVPSSVTGSQYCIVRSPSGKTFLYNPHSQTMTPTSLQPPLPKAAPYTTQFQQKNPLGTIPAQAAPASSGQISGSETLRTLLNAPTLVNEPTRTQRLGRKTITRPPKKTKKTTSSESDASSESDTEEENKDGPPRRVLRSSNRSEDRTPILDGLAESAPGARRRDSDPEWEPDADQQDESFEEDNLYQPVNEDILDELKTLESQIVNQGIEENGSHGSSDEGLQVFRMVNDGLDQDSSGGMKDRVEIKRELVDLS